MNQNNIDLTEFGYADHELFTVVDHNALDSEKITAPRYSYWQSVFRVFFRKKLNIFILSVLAVLLLFTYIYPVIIDYDAEYDPYVNINVPNSTHLSPMQAMGKFGNVYKIADAELEKTDDSFSDGSITYKVIADVTVKNKCNVYKVADVNDSENVFNVVEVKSDGVSSFVKLEEGEILGKRDEKKGVVTYEVLDEKDNDKKYVIYEETDAKTGEKSYVTKDFSLWLLIKNFPENIHWILGAGDAGQSTFDAIWYGSSISVTLALVCAAINLLIGVLIGAVWGFSKKFDIFMIEVYNIVANVPYILLISVIVLIMSASFWTMVFALTITGWIGIAYFIRTQVVIIRDREYNLASRCLGTPIWRIAVKNILPFMTSVIVTLAATEIPSYISYEVFLSYIGMGLKDMSLGKLIEVSQPSMLVSGWGFEFWSPVAIASIIAVVLYVVGQNLGDASDPRTHM